MKLNYQTILKRAVKQHDAERERHPEGWAGRERDFFDLSLATQVGRIFVELCNEFNEQFEKALEQASTEMLERAAVLLAQRAAEKEKQERGGG